MQMQSRRDRGSGSIYKRGKIYYIKYVDTNGKTYQESSSSQFKSDAERLLQDRLRNPVERKYVLDDIIELFFLDYEMREKKYQKNAVKSESRKTHSWTP